MRLFLRNLLIFTFSFFCALAGLILLQRWVLNGRGQFVLPVEKKYIFLGHSHAQTAYNDKLIDSAINIAAAGEAYLYTYVKLKKILEVSSDKKIVFLEYSNNNVVAEMDNWTWGDVYVQDKYRVYSAFTDFDETRLLLRKNFKSTVICLAKSVVNNVYYIFRLRNIAQETRMGSYNSLQRDKTDSLLNALLLQPGVTQADSSVSAVNVAYLQKIIKLCSEKGQKLYLIRSPLHRQYQGFGNEVLYKDILAHKLNQVELLDFRDFPLSNKEFGDLEHLNFRGAERYSVFVNRLLKSGLLEKTDKQKFINEQIAIERSLHRMF